MQTNNLTTTPDKQKNTSTLNLINDNFHSPELIPVDELRLEGRSRSVDQFYKDENLSIDDRLAISQNYKPNFRGFIEVIIGPMFAGKSTELLRSVNRHAISGKRCLYVKYSADTRYDSKCISTHDQ